MTLHAASMSLSTDVPDTKVRHLSQQHVETLWERLVIFQTNV